MFRCVVTARSGETSNFRAEALRVVVTGFDFEGTLRIDDRNQADNATIADGALFRDTGGSACSLSIPVPTARFAAKRREFARLLKKTVSEFE